MDKRDEFRGLLAAYLNAGALSRRDRYLSLMNAQAPFGMNAGRMVEEHGRAYAVRAEARSEAVQLRFDTYNGTNLSVHYMIAYLRKYLLNDLWGAYVHGSLGTGEENAYSDFDALVILRKDVFRAADRIKRAGMRLSEALHIMYQHDPLQHHGWFVLTEEDLESYPEHYLPAAVLEHARSIFPDRGLEMTIRPYWSREVTRGFFDGMSQGLARDVARRSRPSTMYALKDLLSRFMLLPALYVQLRDGRGIFKKFSFDAARVDFTDDEWSPMDEASDIRERWSYRLSPLMRRMMTGTAPLPRQVARKYRPRIPPHLRGRLTEDFYRRIGRLARRMEDKLT